jgi:Flp pilus assembly pilin Flp
MRNLLKRLRSETDGQDLIEYTLMLAFVALASAALFIGAGKSVHGIWQRGNERIATANAIAGGRTTPVQSDK